MLRVIKMRKWRMEIVDRCSHALFALKQKIMLLPGCGVVLRVVVATVPTLKSGQRLEFAVLRYVEPRAALAFVLLNHRTSWLELDFVDQRRRRRSVHVRWSTGYFVCLLKISTNFSINSFFKQKNNHHLILLF